MLSTRHSWEEYQTVVLLWVTAVTVLLVTRAIATVSPSAVVRRYAPDWGLIWLTISGVYTLQTVAVSSLRHSVGRKHIQRALAIAGMSFVALLLAFSLMDLDVLDIDLKGCTCIIVVITLRDKLTLDT